MKTISSASLSVPCGRVRRSVMRLNSHAALRAPCKRTPTFCTARPAHSRAHADTPSWCPQSAPRFRIRQRALDVLTRGVKPHDTSKPSRTPVSRSPQTLADSQPRHRASGARAVKAQAAAVTQLAPDTATHTHQTKYGAAHSLVAIASFVAEDPR
jgi:hypothetical protein